MLLPTNGFGYSCKQPLTVAWSGPPALADDEWYLIEAAKKDHPDQWYGITDWVKEMMVTLNPVSARGGCNAQWFCPIGGGGEGGYFVRVKIVRGDITTHAIKAENSPASEPVEMNYHKPSGNVLVPNVSCG